MQSGDKLKSDFLNGSAAMSESAEAPGRLARGLTVKFEWETEHEAPAAPARHLQQYGIVRSPVYCYGYRVVRDGKVIRRFRTGTVYVRKSQHQWADHVLRKNQGQYIVTTPPHPANIDVQPVGMGDSWGKPTRATGITGFLEDGIAAALGYRFARGRRGVAEMGVASGFVNRSARRGHKRKRRRQRRS